MEGERDREANYKKQRSRAATRTDVTIYSDGSGHVGIIGSAAVLRRRGRTIRTTKFYLGLDSEHTVYEGELVGMILAVELLRTERNVRSATIAVDNKAAIQATSSFQSAPSHYLTDIFHRDLARALRTHNLPSITIRWTPGHVGIPGNEIADKEAKTAADGVTSPANLLPRSLCTPKGDPKCLPLSKSALKQKLYVEIKSLNTHAFNSSPRLRSIRRIDPSARVRYFFPLDFAPDFVDTKWLSATLVCHCVIITRRKKWRDPCAICT